MNIYVSDKEQIEMIKNWWRENGKFIIFSIVAVILLSVGWKYWQNTKNQKAANASALFEQMLVHESNQQLSEVELDIANLLKNYTSTPYSALAAFLSVQNAINQNRLDIAAKKLDWIISHSKNKDFRQIAKIRKARIFLTMKKYDEGLTLLTTIDAKGYLPLINEIKGDILLAKGEEKEALAAYQNALTSLRADSPNRSMLQMKYDQINSQ